MGRGPVRVLELRSLEGGERGEETEGEEEEGRMGKGIETGIVGKTLANGINAAAMLWEGEGFLDVKRRKESPRIAAHRHTPGP